MSQMKDWTRRIASAVAVAALIGLAAPRTAHADTLLADLDADYFEFGSGTTTGNGGVPAAGDGVWDYFRSNTASTAGFATSTLTALPVVEGPPLSFRYSSGNHNINDATVYGTDIALPSDRLYVHPDSNAATAIRWIAGAGEVGYVTVAGVVQRGNQDNNVSQNGSTFAIFKSNAAQTPGSFVKIHEQHVPFEHSSTQPFTEFSFNVNTTIGSGERLFFGVFSDGNTSADGQQIEAQITGQSDAISINFDSNRAPHAPVMTAGDVAGVVARGNWNNAFNDVFTNAALSKTNLVDNWGDDTGARIDWTSGGGSWTVDAQNHALSANHKMMMDHIDARSTGDAVFTISDLPDWITQNGYDVYVYADATTSGGTVISGYTINDSENPAQTFWLQDTATFSGAFVQALGTTKATATAGANYILFKNLTGSSFTLLADSDNFRAEVSGIQIVAHVPAPAAAPAGLALLALAALRRSRRRAA